MPTLPVRSNHTGVPLPDEVLNTMEIAAPLKLAEKAVYVMAHAGEIPTFNFRGQRRIKRSELDRCVDAPRCSGEGGGGSDDGR